jgi:hypothetical protein
MIKTISLGGLLLMAAFAGDPMDDARKGYSNCLVRFSGQHLELKSSENEFRKAAKEACTEQRSTYRAAIVKSELSSKVPRAEAEKYADEEVDYLLSIYTDSYGQYLNDGTRPIEEK